jgi:very-short-patch-repair endonuclease
VGIKTWSIKESNNLDTTKNKRKETCLEIYGAENCLSKNTKAYKKRNKTVKSKYGVSNVFATDSVKNKIKETCLEKYGVENYVQSQEYNQYRNNGIKSHQHDSISKYLDSIGIIHENEYGKTLSKYNVEMGRIYSPRVDIFIPNKKIVIEIYGDSWHANPKSYKPTDEIYKWGGLKKAEDIWEHDNIRVRHIESSGYKVIILWCSDIMKSFEKVTKKLCKLLK